MKTTNLNHDNIICLNGDFVKMSSANLPPIDRGSPNAKGLFETIRVDNGHVFFFNEHLDRLHKSAKYFEINMPDIKWKTIIKQLLENNSLTESIVSLKIIITGRGVKDACLFTCDDPISIITCSEYSPPSAAQYETGWRLKTYDADYAPPLSDHKLLNHVCFYHALKDALDDKMDDAIILDCNQNVTETSKCSLLYFYDDSWFTPKSDYQLPGITLDKVISCLDKNGSEVTRKTTYVMDLLCSDAVFALNSLIGVMPVCEIDGEEVYDMDEVHAKNLRKNLFNCSD